MLRVEKSLYRTYRLRKDERAFSVRDSLICATLSLATRDSGDSRVRFHTTGNRRSRRACRKYLLCDARETENSRDRSAVQVVEIIRERRKSRHEKQKRLRRRRMADFANRGDTNRDALIRSFFHIDFTWFAHVDGILIARLSATRNVIARAQHEQFFARVRQRGREREGANEFICTHDIRRAD